MTEDILTKRLDIFMGVCRDQGVKITPQRLEVYREIASTEDHPDAEQIFTRVRKRLTTISLDTVYRTLWLLKDLGLVATLGASRDRARFDANLARHHHFVCRECGKTRDFYSSRLDELELPASLNALGQAETTQVEVRGICRECAAGSKR